MNAYFILGIVIVVWALGLSAYGLTREKFPATSSAVRAVVAVSALLAIGTVIALMATTKKEHPRIEAAEAAERAGELQKEKQDIGKDETQSPAQKQLEGQKP